MFQVGTSITKQLTKKLTLWLLHFLLFISNSGDTNQPKMGTRKVKEMALGPHSYWKVAKAYKQKASDTYNHKVNAIVRCAMEIREDTYCAGNNCRLLSAIYQLCDVKGFHDSYKEIINVPLSISAT